MGGELEDVTGGEAGEDEASHQLGIGDSDPVTTDQADVLIDPRPRGWGPHQI